MSKQSIQLIVALIVLSVAGVLLYIQLTAKEESPYGDTSLIQFKDDLEHDPAAARTPEELDLEFVNAAGETVKVADFAGRKHVVLVFTRGYHQARCPYCTAQTSRLVASHAKFVERGAEVLVVYPGPRGHVDEFIDAVQSEAKNAKVPFLLLFDEDLAAVDQLNIRWQLARPSTFILDKQGNLCFAYIGKDLADRPSVAAMLAQLDRLNMSAAP
jgi:peroxiredoxin